MIRRLSATIALVLVLAGGLVTWSVAPVFGQAYATPLNNAVSSLGADHVAGSGTLTLRHGEGARFGAPSADHPIRITVADRSTLSGNQIVPGTLQTIFLATGRTGDTLTGLTAVEGTSDRNYRRNDPVASLITAGTITELQGATVDAVRKTGDPQTVTAPTVLNATTTGKATGAVDDLNATIINVSLSANVATITTAAAHGYRPTDLVVVTGLSTSDLNGSWIVVTVPSATTFTFTRAHSEISSTPDTGSATVSRLASIHEFKSPAGSLQSRFDGTGALILERDLTEYPTRYGDTASLVFRQSFRGSTAGYVALAFYDRAFLFNETPTKINLSLQTCILDDGSYYSGRSLIVSQDRDKLTGQIAQMGGQTMIGASVDINAPGIKCNNQLNLPGEKYRYCYAAFDAADVDPNYPAGGEYSDRGFGKNTWLVGPRGETLWGNYLNPNKDDSDPELWRLAKLWLSTTTNHLTVEGSGQSGTTTYLDLYGPPGGNAVLQLGSRGTQNAMWIGSAASSSGIGQIGLGNTAFLNLYNNPIGVAGVSVAIGVDDASSVLTVDSAPSNIGVAVLTARGKNGQIGNLIRAQTYLNVDVFSVSPTGATTATAFQGGTVAASNLTLQSTSHATKGKVLLGSASAYDEANVRLGIGTQSPSSPIHVNRPGSQDFILVQASDSNFANIKAASGSCQTVFGADSASGYLRTVTNHPFSIATNNSRRIYLNAASGLASFGVYGFVAPSYTQDSRIQADCSAATEIGLTVALFSGQTANAVQVKSGSTVLAAVKSDGSFLPASLADSAATNSSLYYSTTAGKLVFKDAAGVVNPLY